MDIREDERRSSNQKPPSSLAEVPLNKGIQCPLGLATAHDSGVDSSTTPDNEPDRPADESREQRPENHNDGTTENEGTLHDDYSEPTEYWSELQKPV